MVARIPDVNHLDAVRALEKAGFTLPSDFFGFGAKPSQPPKCFSVGQRGPSSDLGGDRLTYTDE
jgi:hypothetical protein